MMQERGQVFASAGNDVKIWDPANMEIVKQYNYHKSNIKDLSWSKDNSVNYCNFHGIGLNYPNFADSLHQGSPTQRLHAPGRPQAVSSSKKRGGSTSPTISGRRAASGQFMTSV